MAAQPDIWLGNQYEMMVNGGISYRLYPSLLDKYQSLLDYEEEAEKPWNKWSATSIAKAKEEHERICRTTSGIVPAWYEPTPGDYILTPEEMYEKIESELIDTINREPHEPSMAADRGTSLNEVVDCMLKGIPCQREDMTISTQKAGDIPLSVRVDFDGFTFDFDVDLCRQLRDILKGSICQYLIEAPIQTKYGLVLLYGYMDYWRGDTIIDLKTTSKYDWGNYERKWQRHVYPYCAIESGLTDNVNEFSYLIAQLGKGKIITGHIFEETYSYNHEQSAKQLQAVIESFISWLETHRMQIKDKKIFNKLVIE